MKTGNRRCAPEAYSPWGKQALRPRTEIPTAHHSHELGGSKNGASILPFVSAFDAWESINRYVDEHSEGSKAWRAEKPSVRCVK